jgi:hypothetical protein
MMHNNISRTGIMIFLFGIFMLSGLQGKTENNDSVRAKIILRQIYSFYNAGHDHLLNETYPYKPSEKQRLGTDQKF